MGEALDKITAGDAGEAPLSRTLRKRQRDPLTGLFGQDALAADIELALKKSRKQALAATLALLQLDNFYEIRTWVGKSEANLLLSDIARLLQKSLPESVLLCRCQHYEFAALLVNEASLNARLITDRVKTAMLSAVSQAIPPQLELQCGVGLAVLDSRIPSAEVLFARARHNLCHSRNLSANTESPDIQLQLAAMSSSEPQVALRRIQQGIREGSLRLNFQPTVSLKEDGLQHFEVRSSMATNQGPMPSLLLFELAVRNAMGEVIDRWVVRKAIRLLIRRQQPKLRLTINLTLNSLVSIKFLDWLSGQLESHPALAEQLVFQISEIDILIAQHHIGAFSNRLTTMNSKLSINHFGCTPEPFRYLGLLRADYVKLDVSLLEKINEDPARRESLTKFVADCHERGLRVIAGMVETMSTVPLLWKARVNSIQGNSMQKPGPDLEFDFVKEMTLTLQ